MRKRLFYWSASVLLVISVVLVVWQGSFHLSNFGPSNAGQTFIFWAVSTLIFILMVTVGWILAREFIKLYVARQAKRLGSRIRTKLVVGAMLLSCVPVFFLVLWSYEVLNVNLKAWFTNPVDNQVEVYKKAARALEQEIQTRLGVQAALLAAQPETSQLLSGGPLATDTLQRFATGQGLESVAILAPSGFPLAVWGQYPAQPLAKDGHAPQCAASSFRCTRPRRRPHTRTLSRSRRKRQWPVSRQAISPAASIFASGSCRPSHGL